MIWRFQRSHRRRGVATGLIQTLQRIAGGRKAYVIFVQARSRRYTRNTPVRIAGRPRGRVPLRYPGRSLPPPSSPCPVPLPQRQPASRSRSARCVTAITSCSSGDSSSRSPGTWMQSVAQSWLVYRLTGSAALLGSGRLRRADPGLPARAVRRRRCRRARAAPDPGGDADRVDAARLGSCRPHARGARAGLARVRDCGARRDRQRVRHPRAAGVHRRHGGPRRSGERDRAQLVDVQRRADRRAGRGRRAGGHASARAGASS